jgi:hypothetical protein
MRNNKISETMIGSNKISTLKITEEPISICEGMIKHEQFSVNYNNALFSIFVAEDGGYCATQG